MRQITRAGQASVPEWTSTSGVCYTFIVRYQFYERCSIETPKVQSDRDYRGSERSGKDRLACSANVLVCKLVEDILCSRERKHKLRKKPLVSGKKGTIYMQMTLKKSNTTKTSLSTGVSAIFHNMTKEDVLDEAEPASSSTLSKKKTTMSKLIKTVASGCFTYDYNPNSRSRITTIASEKIYVSRKNSFSRTLNTPYEETELTIMPARKSSDQKLCTPGPFFWGVQCKQKRIYTRFASFFDLLFTTKLLNQEKEKLKAVAENIL